MQLALVDNGPYKALSVDIAVSLHAGDQRLHALIFSGLQVVLILVFKHDGQKPHGAHREDCP